MSEPFRAGQGVGQVNNERQPDEGGQQIFDHAFIIGRTRPTREGPDVTLTGLDGILTTFRSVLLRMPVDGRSLPFPGDPCFAAVMWMDWIRRNLGLVRFTSVAAPIVVSGLLYLTRETFAGPAAALVLVLLVVGASATGDRVSGVLAAVSGALGFDYFLTAPYLNLQIANSADIEVAVMLLAVGFAVNELALWGGRQRAAAGERSGFIAGVVESAELAATGASQPDIVKAVGGHIERLLKADRVEYVQGIPRGDCAIVQRDGAVAFEDIVLKVASDGLPSDRYTAVPVTSDGRVVGYFRVSTATELVRPTAEQLRIAVLLADQVAPRTSRTDRGA